jgi:hypothetical protein
MKSFSLIAKSYRIEFIKQKLGLTNSSKTTHIIPVTVEEEKRLLSENSMTNKKLISVIQSLTESLNETNRPQFKGLASKKKDELLLILQEVKNLHNNINNDEIEKLI